MHNLRLITKKFFKLIIPLLLLTFITALPILFFSSYVHEIGHIEEAKNFGINMKIRNINFMPDIKNLGEWGHAATVPLSNEDCEKYNNLTIENKKEINFAGVRMELLIFGLLFSISLCFLIYYGKRISSQHPLLFSLWGAITLLFIVIIIFSFSGNIFGNNLENDAHVLGLDCKAIFLGV
jgi:amino acid transporter